MKERKAIPEVRKLQEWVNNFAPRHIIVESVTRSEPGMPDGLGYAIVRNKDTGRKSRIRLDQFNPNRQKGFTLVKEGSFGKRG